MQGVLVSAKLLSERQCFGALYMIFVISSAVAVLTAGYIDQNDGFLVER